LEAQEREHVLQPRADLDVLLEAAPSVTDPAATFALQNLSLSARADVITDGINKLEVVTWHALQHIVKFSK